MYSNPSDFNTPNLMKITSLPLPLPPRTPTEQSRDLELAWCAGMFDGDGCVFISRQKMAGRKNRTYRLVLSLVQNCNVTADHFRATLGLPHCLVAVRRSVSHNRQIYDVRYDGVHALTALRLMEPFLVRKRIEAVAARQFWKECRMGVLPGPKGLPPEVWRNRERYYWKLHNLK